MGGTEEGAVLSIISMFMLTPFQETLYTANVELAFYSLFIASLWGVLGFIQNDTIAHLIFLSVSLGLLAGTKIVGLNYSLPLILVVFVLLIKKKRLLDLILSVCLMVLCGGWWYIRNFLKTGNPLYPLDISLLGIIHFPGAYGISAMQNGEFYLNGFSAIFQNMVQKFNPPVIEMALLFIIIWIVWLMRECNNRLLLWIIAIELLWIFFSFHFLIPYNHEVRFFVPFFLLLNLAWSPLLSWISPKIRPIIFWFIAVVGTVYVLNNLLVENMDLFHIFSLQDIPMLIGYMACGVLVFLCALYVLYVHSPKTSFQFSLLLLVFSCILWEMAGNYQNRYRYMLLKEVWGESYSQAWQKLDEPNHPHNIAYTGENIPYPLTGGRFQNKVLYVNISGDVNDDFYSFHQRLQPIIKRKLAAYHKPAYERLNPNINQWFRNLIETKTDYIFIYKLYPIEAQYLYHDKDGFPLERTWVKQNLKAFLPFYISNDVEVYRFVGKDTIP